VIGSISAEYFNAVWDDFSEKKICIKNVKKEKKYKKRKIN
jgi:hypothetical protein